MLTNIDNNDVKNSTDIQLAGKFPMYTVKLGDRDIRMVITDRDKPTASRASWYCLSDVGNAVDSADPKALLRLVKDKESDSRIFTNYETFCVDFKGDDSSPLANRGNTFVSLHGLFEIFAKTELNSDIILSFQDKLYDEILPSIAHTGSYHSTPDRALPNSFAEALRMLADEVDAHEQTKLALEAEKEQHEKDNQDYRTGLTILNAQKAQIASRQVATALSTASVAARIAKDAIQNAQEAAAIAEGAQKEVEKLRGTLRSKSDEAKNIINKGLTTYDESLKQPERSKNKEITFGTYVRNALNKLSAELGCEIVTEETSDGHRRNLYAIEVCTALESRISEDRSYLKTLN